MSSWPDSMPSHTDTRQASAQDSSLHTDTNIQVTTQVFRFARWCYLFCQWDFSHVLISSKRPRLQFLMCFKFLFLCTLLSPVGNLDNLTWVRHSSPKSSTTHSYQYVCVSKQRCGCQCKGFLTCTQMLINHATAHGAVQTPKESLHWN